MTQHNWPSPHTSTPYDYGRSPANPNERKVIVQVIGPDHPDHPDNRAKRAAEAAQKAAEEAAAAAAQSTDAIQPAPPPKKRRKRRRRRRPEPLPPPDESKLARHQRLCCICNSDCRDEIDELFIHWIDPRTISNLYDNTDWQAIYRHAHATGLFAVRDRNLRSALGQIVERACHVTPTVDGVLRAIRAYSCLNADGQWTELPTHVVVSSGSQLAQPKAIAAAAITLNLPAPTDRKDESEQAALPETDNRIETDATS